MLDRVASTPRQRPSVAAYVPQRIRQKNKEKRRNKKRKENPYARIYPKSSKTTTEPPVVAVARPPLVCQRRLDFSLPTPLLSPFRLKIKIVDPTSGAVLLSGQMPNQTPEPGFNRPYESLAARHLEDVAGRPLNIQTVQDFHAQCLELGQTQFLTPTERKEAEERKRQEEEEEKKRQEAPPPIPDEPVSPPPPPFEDPYRFAGGDERQHVVYSPTYGQRSEYLAYVPPRSFSTADRRIVDCVDDSFSGWCNCKYLPDGQRCDECRKWNAVYNPDPQQSRRPLPSCRWPGVARSFDEWREAQNELQHVVCPLQAGQCTSFGLINCALCNSIRRILAASPL
jgi:hypothetical protein